MLKEFIVNGNNYWIEFREQKDHRGTSLGWGCGKITDDNISKFNRTNRHEQFLVFNYLKNYFKDWLIKTNPDKFYFSVPGEKRARIYIDYIKRYGYEYSIEETDYESFD